MWKSMLVAAGTAAGLFASGLGLAQDPSALAADIKQRLERCGEFHGQPYSFFEFFRDHGNRRNSYRFADFQIQNNLLHWKKVLVTRTHGVDHWAGHGHVYYYTVNLHDLAPESLQVAEAMANRQHEGVFYVDLHCRANSQCIHRNTHTLTPPSQTMDGVLTTTDRWYEGPTSLEHIRNANMHICDGHLGGSRTMAESLRSEFHSVLSQVSFGAVVNAGGFVPPRFVQQFGGLPTGPSAVFGQSFGGAPQQQYNPGVAQPYYPGGVPQQPYYQGGAPQQPYYPGGVPQQPYYPAGAPQQPYNPGVAQPYNPGVPQQPYNPGVAQPYNPGAAPQQPYYPPPQQQQPFNPAGIAQQPYYPPAPPQSVYPPAGGGTQVPLF